MASTCLAALSAPIAAFAQAPAPAPPAPPLATADSNAPAIADIIVTARRSAENLQDIPVAVQVVSGDTLKRLAITSPTELSKLAPGLTLTNTTPNYPIIVLRGVSWQAASGTPAIPVYLNEVAFSPIYTLQALYDIGQIEVLRGPQGTARGAPSISGAVIINTHRPDLDEFGGYVQGLLGSGRHRDLQGAVNVPIIKDVLAIRVAGNIEDSRLDRVRSVNSSIDPKFKSRAWRASALFEPTDTLKLEVSYQQLRQHTLSFGFVEGPGAPGIAALGIPANFNGPALTLADHRGVQELPNVYDMDVNLLTVNAGWDVLGQRLNYIYGRQTDLPPHNGDSRDPGNIVPGFDILPDQGNVGIPDYQTHEIRISSIRRPGRFFDYDIGYYRLSSGGPIFVNFPVFLPGAFGAPFASLPGQVTTPVTRYSLPVQTDIGLKQRTQSFYANVQLHITGRTELSGGVRFVKDRVESNFVVRQGAGFIAFPRALPAAAGGCPSPLLPNSPVYGANYCDLARAASSSTESYLLKETPTIYNVSLSQKFSDAVHAYVTVGSSYRSGLPALGNAGLPPNLSFPAPEKATSYEIGVKTQWGRRLRINADIFQIDYKGQLTKFQGIQFFNSLSSSISSTNLSFYSNVDARVRGAEFEIDAEPIENLALNANLSYAKIKSQGGSVPCNDLSRPISAANPINFCNAPKGQTLNSTAPFQATLNGSYTLPLGPFDGYFRFTVNHQGHNPNFGASSRDAQAYTLVDIFAGLTGNKGGWDVGLYAKNITDKQVELTREHVVNGFYALFGDTGYDLVSATRPREIGIQLRYAFGSR